MSCCIFISPEWNLCNIFMIGLQSTVPSNWDLDAMRRKSLFVRVHPDRDYAEYKKVESLFLQTSVSRYKIAKVKLRMHFQKAHLLVACAIVNKY